MFFLSRTEYVIPQFIGSLRRSPRKKRPDPAQSFKSAEKHFVSVPEQLIESESVISHSSATNFPQCVFSNVRNISLTIVNIARAVSRSKASSRSLLTPRFKSVSSRAVKFELPILAHPGMTNSLRHPWPT